VEDVVHRRSSALRGTVLVRQEKKRGGGGKKRMAQFSAIRYLLTKRYLLQLSTEAGGGSLGRKGGKKEKKGRRAQRLV